ncbi:MAG TPA: hypothetical protein VFH43_00705, partial [Candidatus Kapabacteria bacterium]|nr:hypothetical protein [Candidatus Kapabacteria bacterium]
EVKRGISPLLRDTDGDGASDTEEINQNQSNPLLQDPDGDSVLDGQDLCPTDKGRPEYNGCNYPRSK